MEAAASTGYTKISKTFSPSNFFFHFHFLLGLDLLMNLPIMNYDDLM